MSGAFLLLSILFPLFSFSRGLCPQGNLNDNAISADCLYHGAQGFDPASESLGSWTMRDPSTVDSNTNVAVYALSAQNDVYRMDIFYSLGITGFNDIQVPMLLQGNVTVSNFHNQPGNITFNFWRGYIQPQTAGTTVYYRIRAMDGTLSYFLKTSSNNKNILGQYYLTPDAPASNNYQYLVSSPLSSASNPSVSSNGPIIVSSSFATSSVASVALTGSLDSTRSLGSSSSSENQAQTSIHVEYVSNSSQKSNLLLLAYVIPPVGLVLILGSVSVFFLWRSRRRIRFISSSELESGSDSRNYHTPNSVEVIDILHNIHLLQRLGSGHYGQVYKGDYAGTPVACKKLKDTSDQDFFREAGILAKLVHPNIVLFMGIHTSESAERYLVFEYISGGSLVPYLHETGDKISPDDLLNMAIDGARGMAYLSQKHIVHRDLACRNLLIDDHKRIKVSDFGMSRSDMYQSAASESNLPVRWTAPEGLKQLPFTTKSDVFSFGTVLWEIFSLAEQPYLGLSNKEVVEIVCDRDRPKKLEKPARCPEVIYETMQRCWSFNPDSRPAFTEILTELEKLLSPSWNKGTVPLTSEIPLYGNVVLPPVGSNR